jgi:N-acetylglucosaminyl-diphospho-decaprenol L-rhamnosyltransferase
MPPNTARRCGVAVRSIVRDLSVVLVNYRCERHTLACLDHLRLTLSSQPAAVVVIDNSPSGGLSDALARGGDEPSYVAMPSNLGFAAAANRGVAETETPFVVLLNPDARPKPGCLEGLVDRLREAPAVAAAGPVLVPFDDNLPPQPSATAIDPGIISALVEYTIAHRVIGREWLRQNYFLPSSVEPGAEAVDCAMVQGACLALRREAFTSVGGFDAENFFLYWEETDLERRLRQAGWRILYCRDLACRHLGGASLGPGRSQHEGHFWRGFYAYHRKHGGIVRELVLRLLLVPGITAELGVLWILRLIRRDTDRQLLRDLGSARSRLRNQFHRAWKQEAE